jgi:DNA excision repair protein ERCC-4
MGPPPPPHVVADTHEVQSMVPQLLRARGVDIEIEPLPAGDYLVGDRVLVERKSVLDFHGSVIAGRFWRQMGKLRTSARRAYLLIEGDDLDAGPLEPETSRGICVVVLDLGVAIVRSTDPNDSSHWLHRLAIRYQRRRLRSQRPWYDQTPQAPPGEIAEAMLAAVPGISVVCARALLHRFENVAGIIAGGREEWIDVPGIGPARAAALEQAFVASHAPMEHAPGLAKHLPPEPLQHTAFPSASQPEAEKRPVAHPASRRANR